MGEQTDRELLELAAKAAGFTGQWTADWYEMASGMSRWDPLVDNGQALILAVKLSIDVLQRFVGGRRVEALAPGGSVQIEMVTGPDACAATRRAIVRAAAAIAEQGGAK